MSRVRPANIVMAALPGTCREISDRTGIKEPTCREWLLRFHKELGLVYISGWRKPEASQPGPPMAIYCAGSERDAFKPGMSAADQRRSDRYKRDRAKRQRSNETTTQCAIRTQPCSIFDYFKRGQDMKINMLTRVSLT